jgi:hypothetical protein
MPQGTGPASGRPRLRPVGLERDIPPIDLVAVESNEVHTEMTVELASCKEDVELLASSGEVADAMYQSEPDKGNTADPRNRGS